MTTADIIDDILKREGGFVDHPNDNGKATNMGIAMATLAAHRGESVTVEDVKALTEEEARDIYGWRYVMPFAFIFDDSLRALLVDCAVNHGIAGATRLLQRALGVTVDGEIGPITVAMYQSVPALRLYVKVCAERVRHYGRIITTNPSQAVFAAGWANRVAAFIEAAA